MSVGEVFYLLWLFPPLTELFVAITSHIACNKANDLCLFPEKRPDRVYGLGESRLEGIVVKAAGLGHTRASELRHPQEHEGVDFASAVQQVLSVTDDDHESIHSLTIVDLDHALDRLAVICPFSSRKLRTSMGNVHGEPIDELMRIFRRLRGVEAKWLIRLVLKDLRPAEISESLVMRQFHFLMPDLLKIHSSLTDALELLNCDIVRRVPPCPTPVMEKQLKESVFSEIHPRAGTMIGLQPFQKARSLKHCCQLAGSKEVSVERKYDGEYCQIHVWNINIFSKSGRDLTPSPHSVMRELVQLAITSSSTSLTLFFTPDPLSHPSSHSVHG